MSARDRSNLGHRLLAIACAACSALLIDVVQVAAASPQLADEPLVQLTDPWFVAGPADPRLIANLSIILGLGVALLVLAAGFIAARRRLARVLRRQRAELAALRADLDRTEAVLEAQDQLSIVYGAEGPVVHGKLTGIDELPRSDASIVAFQSWLASGSAQALDDLIARLVDNGDAFDAVVHSKGDHRLEAQGRTAGGEAVLTLRNVSGDRLEQIQLHETAAELDRELSGLRALLDATEVPMWLRNTDGRITWVNPAYARAVGAPDPETAITQKRELLEEASRARIAAALNDNEPFSDTVSAVVGGQRITYSVNAVHVGAQSAALARDISEIEAVRDELSRHVEAHTRTLDQIATAVAIFGPDCKLRFCNAAYRALWRLDEHWLDAGPDDGEILDALRVSGRLPEQADYRAWKAKQLASYTSLEPIEQWWHLPDGQTLRVVAEPHPQGGVTYLYDNVTETLQLQSRHNALMNVQRETLDNLNEGVALFSSDGRLRLFNSAFAKLWRLASSQLEAEPHIDEVICWSRVLMDDPQAWDKLKVRVTSLDEGRHGESFRFERPDGTVLDCLTVPLPGSDTLVTFMDVTDAALAERALRERNEALEAADRIKTTFIRHVSYVLRAPLTTITGYADLLARDETGSFNDKQREYTEHVLTSSHALLAIINDILDLATIDAGTMELDFAPVDLNTVMATAAHGLEDRLQEANVELEIQESGDLGTFIADAKRVTQVLFNLLANAITYARAGSRVRVACTRRGDDVLLSVTDAGAGIAPELQTMIFERFESLGEGVGQRGAGLGLSIVKSLVELHGGEVRLDSQPGKGTTVTCVFPISPDVAKSRRHRSQAAQDAWTVEQDRAARADG